MIECDNVSFCHELKECADDNNATRVVCTICWNQYVIRKDWRGIHLNKQYQKIFRKESLQGNNPLFYKYYPQFLKT